MQSLEETDKQSSFNLVVTGGLVRLHLELWTPQPRTADQASDIGDRKQQHTGHLRCCVGTLRQLLLEAPVLGGMEYVRNSAERHGHSVVTQVDCPSFQGLP